MFSRQGGMGVGVGVGSENMWGYCFAELIRFYPLRDITFDPLKDTR